MIIDLFAGPGGWSQGLRDLSPELHAVELGLEWDTAACLTRTAAGHRTIQTDVAAYPTEPFTGRVHGLIASPPCQDFSTAGTKIGAGGTRAQLIAEVIRWTTDLRPEWLVCEQVPPALPIWEAYAEHIAGLGYSTWAGVLNAADYGVPQRRRRAFLIASQTRAITPPPPTHAEHPQPTLFGDEPAPWVTMAEEMGWTAQPEPGWPINSGCDFSTPGDRSTALTFDAGLVPALTVSTKCWHQWQNYRPGYEDWRMDISEMLALQSFPLDYPVGGDTKTARYEQIGNAVPPRLAAHVLAAATGLPHKDPE